MSDRHMTPQSSRRRWLQWTAGAIGAATLGGHATVSAQDDDRVLWTFETGADVGSSPTVIDGTVFIGSADRNVYALDAVNGTEQWRFETGGEVHSSPTVVDGTAFVGSVDKNVYAIDTDSGTEEWHFETGGEVHSSPTVADGTVFFKSRYDNLYAISTDDGTEEWRFEIDGNLPWSPTVVDGTVFIGHYGYDMGVYALDANSGEIQWEGPEQEAIVGSQTVANGTLFFGDNNVRGINTNSGDIQWISEVTGSVAFGSSPTAVDGDLFIGTSLYDGGRVHAINSDDGSQQWTFETDDYIVSSPTVANGTVIVGSRDGNVYALDAVTGEEEWAFEADGGVDSSPTVVNGAVFVGSADGSVYALDAGVEGSSEGSRVRLGTLGHHHSFTNNTGGFDPAAHGFGFFNWAGDHGITVDGEPFEYRRETIDRDMVTNAITEDWSYEANEIVQSIVSRVIYTYVSTQAATNGHCYGMIHAADEFFNNPERLPNSVDSASEIPKPTNDYEEVGDLITQYQTSQIISTESVWIVNNALRNDDVDTELSLDELMTEIDETNTAGVGLYHTNSEEGGLHAVLAYDYERVGDRVIVYVYEPNVPAVNGEAVSENYESLQAAEEPLTKFEVNATTGEMIGEYETPAGLAYNRWAYSDPGLSLSVTESLAGSTESFFKQFTQGLFIGLNSPATIEIESPDETTVRTITTEDVDSVEADYREAGYVLNAPPAEYDITIVGTGSGGYTLELFGVQNSEVVTEELVTGTIAEDESHSVQLRMGETSEETSVETTDDEAFLFGLSQTHLAGVGAISLGLLYAATRLLSEEK